LKDDQQNDSPEHRDDDARPVRVRASRAKAVKAEAAAPVESGEPRAGESTGAGESPAGEPVKKARRTAAKAAPKSEQPAVDATEKRDEQPATRPAAQLAEGADRAAVASAGHQEQPVAGAVRKRGRAAAPSVEQPRQSVMEFAEPREFALQPDAPVVERRTPQPVEPLERNEQASAGPTETGAAATASNENGERPAGDATDAGERGERRGLRRGPRSLIARRRAGKTRDAEGGDTQHPQQHLAREDASTGESGESGDADGNVAVDAREGNGRARRSNTPRVPRDNRNAAGEAGQGNTAAGGTQDLTSSDHPHSFESNEDGDADFEANGNVLEPGAGARAAREVPAAGAEPRGRGNGRNAGAGRRQGEANANANAGTGDRQGRGRNGGPRQGAANGDTREGGPREGGPRPNAGKQAGNNGGNGGKTAPGADTVGRAEPEDLFAYVTSPEFDADNGTGGVNAPMLRRGRKPVEKAKRVLSPDDDAPKLHKVLAEAGMGSRREMEELIIAGRVSVNGEPAHIGQRIMPSDQVRINGKPVKRKVQNKPPRVLIYHKPTGEIVSHSDPEGRASVFDKLPPMKTAKWLAVGRLDFNTEGLLLLTTSGDLANRFMHPRYSVEREYAVRVIGELAEGMRQKLLSGVELEDGPANFLRIADGGGEGTNRWYHVALAEGRNREVRRMFEAVGLTVSRLIRTRHGPVTLPRGLKRGRWEELEDNQVRALLGAVGLKAPAEERDGPRGAAQPRRQPDPMQTALGFAAETANAGANRFGPRGPRRTNQTTFAGVFTGTPRNTAHLPDNIGNRAPRKGEGAAGPGGGKGAGPRSNAGGYGDRDRGAGNAGGYGGRGGGAGNAGGGYGGGYGGGGRPAGNGNFAGGRPGGSGGGTGNANARGNGRGNRGNAGGGPAGGTGEGGGGGNPRGGPRNRSRPR
jgi:23S rRNA pseudouridine2605 synthase